MDHQKEYLRWCEKAVADVDILEELKRLKEKDNEIQDAFFRHLTFGTGGLRGIIGAGTNRMNIYTVAMASQGLANYIIKNFPENKRRIAIGYDSRIKSKTFSQTAASVFSANGIKVFIYRQLMPTPCLSFAVRYLDCSAGVMITASHNPSTYNGYKVYDKNGCQITSKTTADISAKIAQLDIFEDIKRTDFSEALERGMIEYIKDTVCEAFLEEIKKQSVLFGEEVNKALTMIYSPLNGTGLVPVTRILSEMGYVHLITVKEQEHPDGQFSTCPYPNPEVRDTMLLGIEYARKFNAGLLIATDPDCDRVGIGVRDHAGEYLLLSGNETGILLFDYICDQRKKHNRMPSDPIMIKSIVTTKLAEKIADNYGVKTINVLTGFKYIGEQICFLEERDQREQYIFGFEESYGYLSGSYVRDKDGVGAALLICEMFSYYATQGKSLLDKLNELYKRYGYYLDVMHSYIFEGASGIRKMQSVMGFFRGDITSIGGMSIKRCLDYSDGLYGLPRANVLKFELENNCSVILRPSGTEPKIKIYISVSGVDSERARIMENNIRRDIRRMMQLFKEVVPEPKPL